jgi:hypothetical protein
MTTQASLRCTKWGFTLAYLATMGALMGMTMPLVGGVREQIMLFVILPMGLIGAGLMILGRLSQHAP